MGDRWRRLQHRLLNMNPNGRAFCLRELSPRKDIDLQAMAWVDMQDAETLVSQLLKGNAATIMHAPDPHQEKSLRLDAALTSLYREVGRFREEHGQYPLHLCYPFVCGKFQDGTPFRGPLFILPVQLILRPGESPRWELQPLDAPNGYWNHVFLHALELHHGFQPPQQLASLWPEEVHSVADLHTWIHSITKEFRLPVFVQQTLFSQGLPPFRSLIKSTLDALPPGRLDIIKEGTLSLLPVADTTLFQDYETLIRDAGEHPEFLHNQIQLPVHEIPEQERFWISEIDEYQEDVLLSLNAGNNILLHGPPGTGKTQVIRNAIAQALANGRNVLVVSQKRAALEVLHERMVHDGLGEYCALVHDAGADRNVFYHSIRKQIEDLEYTRIHHNTAYLDRLERLFVEDGQHTNDQVAWFEELVNALSVVHTHGFSIHEMYVNRKPGTWNLIPAPGPWDRSILRQFHDALRLLWPLRNSIRPFVHFQPKVSWKTLNAQKIKSWIVELHQSKQEIRHFLESFGVGPTEQLFTTDRKCLEAGRFLIEHQEALLNDVAIQTLWLQPDEKRKELLIEVQALQQQLSTQPFLLEFGKHTFPVWEQSAVQFGKLARSQRLSLRYWKTWRDVSRYLPSGKWLDRRRTWANREQQLTDIISRINKVLDVLNISQRQHRPHDILEAVFRKIELAQSLKQAAKRSGISETERTRILEAVIKREELLESFHHCVSTLCCIVRLPSMPENPHALHVILGDLEQVPPANEADPEAILEAGCCWEDLPVQGQTLLTGTPALLLWDSADEVHESLQQSLFSLWVNEAEERYPALTSLGLPTVELRRQDLVNRVSRMRNTARLVVKHRIEGRILENIRYNRQRNRVTFRDLYHQVTKRRNIWHLRKLVGETWKDELMRLRPCWLMSPEAVAAVFPMIRNLFDLVILDEASQCFSEVAIPVLWRGKQFLVAGDEHQLKPSLLYKTRFENQTWNEEDELQLAESALDLVRPIAVSHYLRWHYRSQHESLIAFSNRHFYDERLLTFPYTNQEKGDTAFRWHRVTGIWKHYVNVAEAEAITDRILAEYQSGTDHSMAVVTFNYHQQVLIQDMLYEKILKSPEHAGLRTLQEELEHPGTNGLIIKNIENIQGDERDVILYSVGYGPDTEGVFASRFGSLNQPGGENRLNVAITRARKRVEVYCSFLPELLRTTEDQLPGPRMFKTWLQYVLDQSGQAFESKQISVKGTENALARILLSRYPGLKIIGKPDYGNARIKIPIAVPQKGLAIDCEGPEYVEAPSVRAREVYRPSLLEARGWKYLRIWARRPQHPDLEPFT